MIEESEILDMLREVGALKEGHFKLASGRHSGHYVQCALLAQYPDRLDRLIRSRTGEINALGNIHTVFFPAIGAMAVILLVVTVFVWIFVPRLRNLD